jgi:hypothetical protein
MLSRRKLLGHSHRLGAGLLGAGLLPGRLWAAPEDKAGKKFLFVFASGGWDPTWVFAPIFDSPTIYIDPQATAASISGVGFTDSSARPSVRSFFERYAAKTCIINGFEVRSVTHERCRRLLMTGKSQATADDWPSILAGAVGGYLLPHLVVSGPAYTSTYTTSVMRLGETGQFAGLLDGSALASSEPALQPPSTETQAAMDAFVQTRLTERLAKVGTGRESRFFADMQVAADQLALVRELSGLDLSVNHEDITPVSELVKPALECFEKGYSRCAMVAHEGLFNVGWDSHSSLEVQSDHFELLFSDLMLIMNELDTRRGTGGAPLSEEVVVVVVSEMGRGPVLNATNGKDHWTFTSMMMLGPGVKGGQVLGGYDADFVGLPVDTASGMPSESGTLLSSGNIGNTLLALADVDPVSEEEVVLGALT